MRIVTYKRIQEFATKHPNTQAPLNVWYHTITAKSWQNLTDIKHDFNSVDYVGNHRYVFNIKGIARFVLTYSPGLISNALLKLFVNAPWLLNPYLNAISMLQMVRFIITFMLIGMKW